MAQISLSKSAYARTFAGTPEVYCQNRFFEANPLNQGDSEQRSLLARSGSSTLASFNSDGILRGAYSEDGLFGSDLFVVLGQNIFRYAEDGVITPIQGSLNATGYITFAFQKGYDYERLFLADGNNLFYYEGVGAAKGTLTQSENTDIAEGYLVSIAGIYFLFVTTVTGTPSGSSSDPFEILVGTDNTSSLLNLYNAINATGTAGTDYSSNLTAANTLVKAVSSDATTLVINSIAKDATGNSIAVTSSGSGMSWASATLEGGGTHILSTVTVPDDKPVSSITSISSYILFSLADSDRFYWINPAETTVDALNYATAESHPDNINQVVSVGDSVWLIGTSSLEVWTASGDSGAPFTPVSGRAYSRGAINGTAVVVKDSVYLVGNDNIVYQIGGGVNRVSHTGIEEKIRKCLDEGL